MTGFLRLTSEDGSACVINLSHVKFYKLMDNKISFIMTTTGTASTVINKAFRSPDLAKDYYDRLTEYLEITI